MNNGYRELVLTLQNIMYSDSELKYITKERNIGQFRIERICNSNTDEISGEVTYRNCILIRKSTVDYLESLGYNLFRQFESSINCAYYERPWVRNLDDEDYDKYKLVTMLEYSLDIYCYAMPPPSTRRRYPVVSSTIYVSTHSIPNASESAVDTPLGHNLNGLEYVSDVSHPASGILRSSSGYTNESVWGSRSRLPTSLAEPISNTFWNNLPSEELSSSSDSDSAMEPGGVFVKLATLNSTRSRSDSDSRGSTRDGSDDEIMDIPNLNRMENHESSNQRFSGEGILNNPRIDDEDDVPMSNDNLTMSSEGTIVRRNETPGMSSEDNVPKRNDGLDMSDESTTLMRYFNSTTSDPGVAGCIENVHIDLGEVTSFENCTIKEYAISSECDASVKKDLKATHLDSQFNTSIQPNEKFSRGMNVNKRTSSSTDESPGTSFWCSKESKQSKLSFDDIGFRASHSTSFPAELLTIGNIRPSLNNLEPRESAIEKVEVFSNPDNPQHSSSINIQQNNESHDNVRLDTLQGSREACENRSYLDQTEEEINSEQWHITYESFFSQNETSTTINQHSSSDHIQDQSASPEVLDIDEDLPLDNSMSEMEESFPFDTAENRTLSMARIERRVAFYSFLNRNRITDSLQFPVVDPVEAFKSNLNHKKHVFLSPLNVPLVWSRKCEDLQYLLSLKLSQPHRYIQEYNRIRKSKLNILDCLRNRETSGVLHQTKVMEVIAQPHYNIYPPADEEDIRTMLEDVRDEEEMDLCGYLMVSLSTHRTFYSFAEPQDDTPRFG